MKCLSVAQPWCWAIMAGLKSIENRGWKTSYRGRLAIHATAQMPSLAGATLLGNIKLPCLSDLPRGAIVGMVELVDCLCIEDLPPELRDDPHAVGPWCWLFTDPRLLAQPLSCKGRPGLWDVPEALADDLDADKPLTRVVNVRTAPPGSYVYVGRAMPRHKNPAIRAGSIWGNPFRAGDTADVLTRYRQHVLDSPELVAQLPTLRGRTLGCWCYPNPCHADFLAELADGPLGDPW